MVEVPTWQAIASKPTTQTTTSAAATTTTTPTAAAHKSDTCILAQQSATSINLDPTSVAEESGEDAAIIQSRVSARAPGLNEAQPRASTSASGYRLRDLKHATDEESLWSTNFNVPSLSANLIDETLNYFVNCRQRVSQITKTFDDSDAYILLLQEKEMDLELVARIGQDLLKQFNEVKDSNEGLKEELAKFHELNERLKDELAKCQEDNRQLRYELASKASLLDTFMEEEEHLHHQDTAGSLYRSDANDEEFTSLRSQSDRAASANESNLYKRLCELQDELLTKDEVLFKQNLAQQERNLHLEMQLRESERRLSGLEAENETLRDNQRELYDELRTYSRNFAELLRIFSETQREARANDIGNTSFESFSELPPPAFDSHLNSTANIIDNLHYDTQNQIQGPHQHQQSTCQQSIVRPIVSGRVSKMVASSSLHEEMQESLLKPGEMLSGKEGDDGDVDEDNVECEETMEADDEVRRVVPRSPGARRSRNHHYQGQARAHQTLNHASRHLSNKNDSDSGGVSDGTDSGLHTTNISTSTSPISIGLMLDTDSEDATSGLTSSLGRSSSTSDSGSDSSCYSSSGSEDIRAKHRKNWLGLSTFTLTTLLLLCLSASFNTTTNSNLAQKLQMIKFDR